jgi:hypothetical protein
VLEGVILFGNYYIKGFLFLLCDDAVIVLTVLIISENPESIGVIPKGLDKSSLTCFSSLRAHQLHPKFCPFVGYAAFEEVWPSNV